ncbi:uncharacterized protein LOC113257061 [Ursus arctos]|uniref:uncharacterized protein LOC113257061 n=1 Tax=Ursus arctos TaxID=9644 RepID=UPI001CF9009A|nr:uncharacterized protein LOC113257061 [Ursus arctos]
MRKSVSEPLRSLPTPNITARVCLITGCHLASSPLTQRPRHTSSISLSSDLGHQKPVAVNSLSPRTWLPCAMLPNMERSPGRGQQVHASREYESYLFLKQKKGKSRSRHPNAYGVSTEDMHLNLPDRWFPCSVLSSRTQDQTLISNLKLVFLKQHKAGGGWLTPNVHDLKWDGRIYSFQKLCRCDRGTRGSPGSEVLRSRSHLENCSYPNSPFQRGAPSNRYHKKGVFSTVIVDDSRFSHTMSTGSSPYQQKGIFRRVKRKVCFCFVLF